MRSEHEMMQLILNTARSEEHVLAAYLKGSRTNPKVPKDIYRDFDVMYVVSDIDRFRNDTSWMNAFGTVVLKQEQDDAFGYGERFGLGNDPESYSWLLLFEDGNRIDIGIETLSVLRQGIHRNKLFLPLLDKIGCLPSLPPPTDEDFYVKMPSEKQYLGCCNEFYWCLCDVAKGIARDELPFAMSTYNTLVRDMLELMLTWYIGTYTNYSVSCGKQNKYLKNYLPPEFYQAYVATYTDGNYVHFWRSIDTSYQLFRKTALLVADCFQFPYPEQEEQASRDYVQTIQTGRLSQSSAPKQPSK